LENLTDVERAFYVAWHLESEVNSGGFQSYYFYSLWAFFLKHAAGFTTA
jgi:hypothetical protein